MKLGILGGSFNPPHYGHLSIAEFVQKSLKLDKLLLVPANIPPHKTENTDLISVAHRLKMTKLAIKDSHNLEVCDIEAKTKGISYTIDLVKKLYKKYKITGKIFVVIGSDWLEGMNTWKQYEKLQKKVTLVCIPRQGFEKAKAPNGWNMITLPFPETKISSTSVRFNIKNDNPWWYQVPVGVVKYIKKHKLYR